jgi:hypothetical protein
MNKLINAAELKRLLELAAAATKLSSEKAKLILGRILRKLF